MKHNTASILCDVFCIAMLSIFLFGFRRDGYLSIAETKLWIFVVLALLFLFSLSVTALWQRKKQINRKEDAKPLSSAQWLILFYLLWTLISAFASPWRSEALLGGSRCEGALVISLYALTALMLSRFSHPKAVLLHVSAGSVLFYCLICFLQFFDLNPFGLYPRGLFWSGRNIVYNGSFIGFSGNADISASILCLFFPLFTVYAIRKRRYIFLLPALCCFAVIVFSQVSGSLLGALGGLLLSLPFMTRGTPLQRRRRTRMLLCFLILVLAVIYVIPFSGLLGEAHSVLHGNFDDRFGSGRIFIWRNTLPLLRERLLLGGGADCFSHRMTAVFSRVTEDGTTITRGIDCAHCEYLNILVNQGLPALVSLLAAMLLTFKNAIKTDSDASVMFASAMLCYGIQAAFGISMPANTAYFWILWGINASLPNVQAAPHSSDVQIAQSEFPSDCPKI